MMGVLHAVCADIEEVRGKLRAFDWLVAGLGRMGDGWMKG